QQEKGNTNRSEEFYFRSLTLLVHPYCKRGVQGVDFLRHKGGVQGIIIIGIYSSVLFISFGLYSDIYSIHNFCFIFFSFSLRDNFTLESFWIVFLFWFSDLWTALP